MKIKRWRSAVLIVLSGLVVMGIANRGGTTGRVRSAPIRTLTQEYPMMRARVQWQGASVTQNQQSSAWQSRQSTRDDRHSGQAYNVTLIGLVMLGSGLLWGGYRLWQHYRQAS